MYAAGGAGGSIMGASPANGVSGLGEGGQGSQRETVSSGNRPGGNGGSGIVIVRYAI